MQHKFFAKKRQESFQLKLSCVYTYPLNNIFFHPHFL